MRFLKPFILAFALSVQSVCAQPIARVVNLGADLANGTSRTITVTTLAQTVTFPAPCSQITLNNLSGTYSLYFQPFGGAATTSNFAIAPGQAFTWTTTPALKTISLYASGSSSIGVLAH